MLPPIHFHTNADVSASLYPEHAIHMPDIIKKCSHASPTLFRYRIPMPMFHSYPHIQLYPILSTIQHPLALPLYTAMT